MVKYCFRLDDICETLDWNKFNRLKEIFNKYKVKPLLGVIPNNEDNSLIVNKPNPDYLKEIDLLVGKGWEVSIHGFKHLYCNKNPGILKYPNKSEFAGLSFEEQKEKINKGMLILEKKGIKTNIFMAPSHSFDAVTIEVLKSENIKYITDGFGLFPYKHHGIVFVPQQVANVREFLFGNITFCLHPNNLTEKNFQDIEIFLEKNHSKCVRFNDIKKYSLMSTILNFIPYYVHKSMRLSKNLR